MSGLGGGNMGGGRSVRDPALGATSLPTVPTTDDSSAASVSQVATPAEQARAEQARRETLGAGLGSDLYGGPVEHNDTDEGLLPPTEGMDEFDREIAERLFAANNIPNPYNANTTPGLGDRLENTTEFRNATGALGAHINNPTETTSNSFVARMQELLDRFPNGNVMELLFLVFRTSIQETNRDKSYFLERLKEYNKMGEALSDYLDDLTDSSRDLEAKKKSDMSAGAKQDVTVKVVSKKLDMTGLNAEGNAVMVPEAEKSYTTAALTNLIKDCEAMQEDLRNRRQIVQTAFQNFDQKTNQLYNLLSQAVKTMNEMRFAGIKNLL